MWRVRYTHIGIEDQARALAKLPSLKPTAPGIPAAGQRAANALHFRRR